MSHHSITDRLEEVFIIDTAGAQWRRHRSSETECEGTVRSRLRCYTSPKRRESGSVARSDARWLSFGSIAAVAGGFWLGWARAIAQYQFVYTDYNPAYWRTTTILNGANPTAQVGLILSHPFLFVVMVSRSLFAWEHFRSFVGLLGWVDAALPSPVILGYGVAFFLALWLDLAPQTPLSLGQRALCLGAWLASAFTFISLLYITINTVNTAPVLGYQGRYLIPVAPLLSLAFYRGRLVMNRDARTRAWIAGGFVAWIVFSLLTTLWSLTCRYWVGSSA